MPIQKSFNKKFFKKWSSDMAYILGFLFADGNIIKTKRNTHFVSLHIADKDLLVEIRSLLKSNHAISKRSSPSGRMHRIQIGSRELYIDLVKKGLTPNKSRRMKLPHIPNLYFGDFVRGYFDGDGNVWKGYVNTYRANPTLVLQAAFTSASLDFLSDLRKGLQMKGIKGGSLFSLKNKNYSRLTFSTHDALKLYKIMYNATRKLYLPRKKVVFEGYMKNMRP